MLKRFTVLGLVLLPLAASAQVPARVLPGTPPAGITVQGRGVARFPVKDVQFVAYARGNGDEESVLSALRAAGVENPSIGPGGPQMSANSPTMLRGIVRDVSHAKLDALRRAAAAYALAHPGVVLDSVLFSMPSDACPPHEQEARAAAIADARRRAQALAALAGVALEGVVGVSETGGCPPVETFAGPQSALDLGTLTSNVVMTETVMFAIVPASGSLPRRPL